MLTLDIDDLYGSWDDWSQGNEAAYSPETQAALDSGQLVLAYREDGDENQAIVDAVRSVQAQNDRVMFVLYETGISDVVFVAAFDQDALNIPEPD